jgi:hypothetical protein
MKRTKAQRLLVAACGPALGVLFAVPVSGLLGGSAGADTSGGAGGCYPSCTMPTVPSTPTPTPTSNGASTTPVNDGATTASTASTAPTSSGLAFTGADIEEMAVIGVVAIGVGTVLVRGRRRTA